MSGDEFKQVMEDFTTRIQFLEQDFVRLVEDFGAYEDEEACAWCGKKGQEVLAKCEHCCARFCPKCFEEALKLAQERKEKAP